MLEVYRLTPKKGVCWWSMGSETGACGPGRGYAALVDENLETYSVEEAAKVLGRTPGRIRQMLRGGELSGEHEGGDERKPWRVHKWSAHALRDRLQENQPGAAPGPLLEARESREIRRRAPLSCSE
jgi:hypothetical protein